MKVSFIALNSSYTHTNLALYYFINNSIPKGVRACVKEFNINMHLDVILKQLYNEKSDIYFFSCYIWNIEYILKLSSSLKKITNAKIVLGGSEVSYTPLEYLKYPFIDYIIADEGEETIKTFLDNFNNNINGDILNVFTKSAKNFSIKYNSVDFNNLIFPYENIDMKVFKDKIIYYESSRGCPFACSYCISCINKSLRFRDLEKVEKEILFFIENKVKLVKFIDRTFNSDINRGKKILKFIIKHNISTKFHFEICADLLDDEFINIINETKDIFQFEIGIQSINPNTLKEINRKNNLEKIEYYCKKLSQDNKAHIHLDLIAGLPFEDLSSFKSGFNFVYKLNPHMLQLGFLKVLKGTYLYENIERYNIEYNSFPPYEVIKTKWISYEKLLFLKDIEDLVDKYYNSGTFKNTLEYFTEKEKEPFDFYEKFCKFLASNNIDIINVSKDNLYIHLFDFLKSEYDEDIVNDILLYDYILLYKRNLSGVILNKFKVKTLNKEDVFSLIKEETFKNQYLKDFGNITPKEIYKKISIYKFDFNPCNFTKNSCTILFTDKIENPVIGNRFSALI